MSDLISRSELYNKLFEVGCHKSKLHPMDVMKMIQEEPIAYDIDKVVEELESNSFITVKQEKVQTKRKDFQSYISVEKEVVLLKDAIEIVKHCGVGKEVN